MRTSGSSKLSEHRAPGSSTMSRGTSTLSGAWVHGSIGSPELDPGMPVEDASVDSPVLFAVEVDEHLSTGDSGLEHQALGAPHLQPRVVEVLALKDLTQDGDDLALAKIGQQDGVEMAVVDLRFGASPHARTEVLAIADNQQR